MKIYIVWFRGYLDADDAWSIEKIFRTQKSAEDYMKFLIARDDKWYYRINTEEVADE